MEVPHKLSALLFSCSFSVCKNNNQSYNVQRRVSIIPFSLSKVEMSNLQLIPIYQHLKRLNAFLSTLHYKCASYECIHSNDGATVFSKKFKNVLLALSSCSFSSTRWLAWSFVTEQGFCMNVTLLCAWNEIQDLVTLKHYMHGRINLSFSLRVL
jgi:hypothetical protein